MRILMVVSCVTAHDGKFVRSLSAAGHTVRIFSFHSKHVDPELTALPNVSLDYVHLNFMPRVQRFFPRHLLRRLKRTLREFKPDILHGGNTWNESYLAALTNFHPFLVVPYGSDVLLDNDRSFMFRRANRIVFSRADWAAPDAQYVKRKIMADYNFPEDRFTILPKGIDVESIARLRPAVRDAAREELGVKDAFVVAMTRNHEEVYGIDIFLRGIAPLLRDQKDVRVLMVGGGSLTKKFQDWTAEQGLADRFLWKGRVPQADLLRYLQAADLYVSTSHSDGTSVSLLEAMASSLPVVVTDVPSTLEWITAGTNGEVVPRGNSDALAETLRGAYHNRDKFALYGERNLAIVRDRGDWRRNFADLMQAYEQMLRLPRAS
jgi:L-malate glycosyltransferase